MLMLKMALLAYISLTLLGFGFVNSENATLGGDTCALEPWDSGPWGQLLEEWVLTSPSYNGRHARIMALPPTKGYYVTERIDGPFPPSPPSFSPQDPHMSLLPPPSASPPGPPSGPPLGPPPRGHHVPPNYNEWEAPLPPAGGKIVNRPPNPYKDMFRPSYPPPIPSYQSRPPRPASDRVDDPPRKQVSETDLYLLGAIEKLVYRVDLMEKRLRRMEENLHYLVAGAESKQEPCAENFTRSGDGCYHWSVEALDWKGASLACRRLRSALLELPEPTQRRQLVSAVLADKLLRGKDFWTGGLNPGLLWIWSHSARPVQAANTTSSIVGEGRCLALVFDPSVNTYVYRGQDCALKHRYVCQKEEDKEKLSNEIERAAKKLRMNEKRKSKLLWEDDTVS